LRRKGQKPAFGRDVERKKKREKKKEKKKRSAGGNELTKMNKMSNILQLFTLCFSVCMIY
jgi:hypothetical protein